jgi:hypothetical protein
MMQRRLFPVTVSLVVLVLVVLATSCRSTSPPLQAGEEIVPFENVVINEDRGSDYTSSEPQLSLIMNEVEFSQLKPLIRPEHLEVLQQIDYSKYALLLLFRGVHGSSRYQCVIERITKHENTLIVRAQFWEQASGESADAVVTSPYHIVKIDKTILASGNLKLELQSYPIHN